MISSEPDVPALVGLDWGTSSLRAWLLDGQGTILRDYRSAQGILNLPEGGFPAVLEDVFAGWGLDVVLPMLACGMVGSINGWMEVPYLPCPVSPAALATAQVPVETARGTLFIVPGLMAAGGTPDVMRGEETQILGALAGRSGLAGDAVVILPGTHSKWARIRDGGIVAFRTFMTGELFAVLTKHSILGRLMPAQPSDPAAGQDAFALGIRAGASSDALASLLFSTRSLVLAGRLAGACTGDYLSGLLIGDEIRAGLALPDFQPGGSGQPARTVLVGDAALCARYSLGFSCLGHPAPAVLGNTAPEGLFRIALAAGLLATGPVRVDPRPGAVA